MRVGHFLHRLNPYGTERALASLLKYRSSGFQEQFVVSLGEGPMRKVYESYGVEVLVSNNLREIDRKLRQADLVNLHLLDPNYVPPPLTGKFPRPKVVTIHYANAFPREMGDRFIATSEWALEIQPDRKKCDLIPNCIDLEPFHGERRLEEGHRILARVGRSEKFDEPFWYAMAPVLADYPDTTLHIAGTQGVSSERVRLLGVLPDVVEFLARSYMLVHVPQPELGSRDLTPMEAMAMGVPCVFTDAHSVREIVRGVMEHRAGLVVRFYDAEALGQGIRFLLDHADVAAEVGRNAREYALKHFDVRERVAQYERVYAEVA